MIALSIVDAFTVRIIQVPDPIPYEDNVVIRVEAAPICGSDINVLYKTPGEKRYIPGHEVAGIVIAVDRPSTLQTNDRVCMVNPRFACGGCEMCQAGWSNYCTDSQFTYGFTGHGFQAQYALVNERSLCRIPDWMSYEDASLILDPVGTPYHAFKRMGTNRNHKVGVFGLGPMGLGAVSIGVFYGATVIAFDPNDYRRKLAKTLGANSVIDPVIQDPYHEVLEVTKGYGLDHVLECSGTQEALSVALDVVRPFGAISLIGESEEALINPSEHFLRKEISLSGSTCFPMHDCSEIIELYAQGLDPRKIITHRHKLQDASLAYKTFNEGNTGKVILYNSFS